jgi:hypothetical protein
VKGFWKTGHFKIAYAVKTKTIEKALPGFKEIAEKYGINGSRP